MGKDELISVGFRYVKRSDLASQADKQYWVEIPDEKLAQQVLEFVKQLQGNDIDG